MKKKVTLNKRKKFKLSLFHVFFQYNYDKTFFLILFITRLLYHHNNKIQCKQILIIKTTFNTTVSCINYKMLH